MNIDKYNNFVKQFEDNNVKLSEDTIKKLYEVGYRNLQSIENSNNFTLSVTKGLDSSIVDEIRNAILYEKLEWNNIPIEKLCLDVGTYDILRKLNIRTANEILCNADVLIDKLESNTFGILMKSLSMHKHNKIYNNNDYQAIYIKELSEFTLSRKIVEIKAYVANLRYLYDTLLWLYNFMVEEYDYPTADLLDIPTYEYSIFNKNNLESIDKMWKNRDIGDLKITLNFSVRTLIDYIRLLN